jgi:hypothetical protein
MTTSAPRPTSSRRTVRRRPLVAAVVAALCLLLGGPATAASSAVLAPGAAHPSALAQSAPGGSSTGGQTASWGVQPARADGPDSRAWFTYSLAPGAVVEDVVAVSNPGDQPITLRIYASDAITTATGAFDLLAAGEEPTDVGSWISLAADEISLDPGQTADIPFTLTVPGNASPGDHAGGIVASMTVEGEQDGSAVLVDRRVGSRVYLRVDGPLQPALVVEDLSAAFDGGSATSGRVTLRYTVRNTGNVRLPAAQRVQIEGPFGTGVVDRELDELPEILPGSALGQEVVVDDVTALGRLSASVVVLPAEVPGASTGPSSASATVWALTTAQVVFGLVLLVVLAALSWWVGRRRRRRSGVVSAGPVADRVGAPDAV